MRPPTTPGPARRLAVTLALAPALLVPPSAQAAGGDSIATAPVVQPGVVMAGISEETQFWRIDTFSGDRLDFNWTTIRGNDCCSSNPVVYLLDPEIDDSSFDSLDQAAVHSDDLAPGPHRFSLTAPFAGPTTIAVNPGYDPTYTFTVSVAHATSLTLAPMRHLAKTPRTPLEVTGIVRSSAGVPVGSCTFDRIGGKGAPQSATAPVDAAGRCTATMTTGRRGRVRYRVRYIPDNGWLAAETTSQRVVTPKRRHKRKRGRGDRREGSRRRAARRAVAAASVNSMPQQALTTRMHGRQPGYVLGETDNGAFLGMGVARPKRLESAMGFEYIRGLRWKQWGRKRATARGWFGRAGAPAVGAEPTPARRVTFVAFDRGRHADCDDGPAYRKLRIKVRGQSSNTLLICQ